MYHIYNQGNNRQKIFFSESNYYYFIKKLEIFVLPFADILAWCLMPNHFHLMILVNEPVLTFTHSVKISPDLTDKMTSSHLISKNKQQITKTTTRSLNNSIAIALRSYTRAINIQQQRTGSLFRAHTQANSLENQNLQASHFSKISLKEMLSSENYPQICFDYIHMNPVKAGLVTSIKDWKFSSAQDFSFKRKKILTNVMLAKKILQTSIISHST